MATNDLRALDERIHSSEEFLRRARGGDAAAERQYLARLRRQRRALTEADGIPTTTGDAGLLMGARLYDEAAARRDEDRAAAQAVWHDKQEARA